MAPKLGGGRAKAKAAALVPPPNASLPNQDKQNAEHYARVKEALEVLQSCDKFAAIM